MLKVVTIVGTRPEIIKLSRVICELDLHVEHILVHTGQNFDYELNEIFFQQLAVRKPDYFLQAAAGTAARTIGNVIAKTDELLTQIRPDAVLVLGDTNSCLAVIAAKRLKIPVFHMEAGNRCFDQRVPEETNRKIIDHTSDINIVFSEHARRYLLAEGIRPETIIKTGSPMKEVLDYYLPEINTSDVLERLNLPQQGYLLVSAHREENVDDSVNFSDLLAALNLLVTTFELPVIVSTHPRTRQQLEARGAQNMDARIIFLKPLGFFEYVKLEKFAFCVVSDSGTLTEESSILGFPAVTVRQSHERPEGMDEGTLIMSGLKPEAVVAAVRMAVAHYSYRDLPFRLLPDYDVDNVSLKVLRIIMSYTEYVNRTVWFRQ